jgi:signal transduction histidine kinase
VEEVVVNTQARLNDDTNLITNMDEAPICMVGDHDRVRQVIVNLVENAIKYSPDGGEIEVGLANTDAGEKVRLWVADQGIGIPVKEQRRIFEKFYRLDPNQTRGVGGTGLGLYICRELVHRMGGAIEVRAAEGGGSVFTVDLPVEEPVR